MQKYICTKENPPHYKSNSPGNCPKCGQKLKDEKKVLAGKARAATGIKNKEGKYVSKIFANEVAKTVLATKKINTANIAPDNNREIKKLLKEAKLSKKDIKEFYEKHSFVFETLKQKGELKGTMKNSNQIEKSISDYNGKIFIDDGTGKIKQVNKSEAKLIVVKFKQYLSSNINVVDFTIRPTLTIDGRMILKIPNQRKLIKDLKEYFGVEDTDELNDFTGAEISKAISEILDGIYTEEGNDIVIYAS